MARPKGLGTVLYAKLKDEGRLDSWLAEHKEHTANGTLEGWLADQGINSGSPEKPAAKASPLSRFASTASACVSALADMASGKYSEADTDQLGMALDVLGDLREMANKALRQLSPVLAELREKARLVSENEAMKARIAELELQLVANGHSDKVRRTGKPKLAAAGE